MKDDLYHIGGDTRSYVVPSTWPYDKHPNMPELKARSTVEIVNFSGCGEVVCIHASYYLIGSGVIDDCYEKSVEYAKNVIVRIYYDGNKIPDIEMPFFDFLGDCDCSAETYATLFFSKVPHSHNFRLKMPFAKGILMTLENPTDQDLMGYTDVQINKKASLPKGSGYLFVENVKGEFTIPEQVIQLFSRDNAGKIVAHWFCMEGDHHCFKNGEGLCEGNCEFYLDDGTSPAAEYLGIEDLYGFSWGFNRIESDGYCAVIKRSECGEGASIGVIRCRTDDAIEYAKSARLVIDYRQEYFSRLSKNPIHTSNAVFSPRERYSAKVKIDSCIYYYELID